MMRSFKNELATLAERYDICIDYLPETSSTNDTIASPGYQSGDLVLAETQMAGRGQRGNSWSSLPGENLTFSQLFYPTELPADRQFYISKAVSLALVDTIGNFGLTATVKWPNDIYIGNRKIVGMLIENDLMGVSIQRSILGIGLNVNQTDFDPALPNPTSMAMESGGMFSRTEVLDRYLDRITHWFHRLTAGDWETIDRKYRENLFRGAGEHLFAEPGGEPFRASIETIEPTGELILRRPDGSRKAYLFKEVEFIL